MLDFLVMDKINYTKEDLCDHIGIGAVIKNDKNEILMQDHVKYGFWTIPVGKVKEGQSIEDGLKQELLEECSIKVEKSKELIVKEYSYDRLGKTINVIGHIFEILKYKGNIKNNEPHKHKQQMFLPLDKIKSIPYLSDSTLLYLETLGIKRKARI